MKQTTLRQIGLVVAALAAAAGCSSNGKMCAGDRIRCSRYTAQGCASFEGCTAMPNCAILDNQVAQAACGLKTTQAACAAPKCSWTGAACVDTCSTITTPDACDNNPGDRDQQTQSLLWGCKWAECAGEPKIKYCGDYTIAMCPAGCAVLDNCPFGDCP